VDLSGAERAIGLDIVVEHDLTTLTAVPRALERAIQGVLRRGVTVDRGDRFAYDRPMSVAVSLEELGRRVDEFGDLGFLITTDGRSPHIVSARVTFDGSAFFVPAGSSSERNIGETSTATLLWPSPDGGPYCLIVDGAATTDGGQATVQPTKAVLHRLADASTDLPSCVRIETESDRD
jgi:hypothetical protein